MKAVYALLFGLCLGCVYALLYYLNHKTPLPKGCENIKAECDGCKITSCDLHPTHNIKEKEND